MAFHPLEAVVEFGIVSIVPFIYPIHPLAIGLFLLNMMIYNVYGHLGFELYPKGIFKEHDSKMNQYFCESNITNILLATTGYIIFGGIGVWEL